MKKFSDEFREEMEKVSIFYDQLTNEVNRLKTKIEKDKNWLNYNQPMMNDSLNRLQRILQEKNIIFFSELITTTAQDIDVIRENQKVVFDLYTKNDMSALRLFNQNNELNGEEQEDITSGGEKNVIATALRALVLWRLTAKLENQSHVGSFKHRKFLFMDEPDCWLSTQSMPAYAEFINQLAEYFDLQVLMVTHHNPKLFEPYAKVYQLENTDGYVQLNCLSEINRENEEYKDYIQSVRLQNFKSFKDNTLELDPKLTIVVGKSNIGKSVIMEAFNAVINNQSQDSCIRHHENKASVLMNVVNHEGKTEKILWERTRKTNTDFPQKVRYKLFNEKDQILHEEYNSSQTPEFIEKVLQMKKIDGVEVHLGSQDDMSFLFNSRISDIERAKILSLGKETAYIHQAMHKLKQKTKETKSETKYNEQQYNKLLEILANNRHLTTKQIKEIYQTIKEKENKTEQQENTINKIQEILNQIENNLTQQQYLNKIKNTQNIKQTQFNKITQKETEIQNIQKIIKQINYNTIQQEPLKNKQINTNIDNQINQLKKQETQIQYVQNIGLQYKNTINKIQTYQKVNKIQKTENKDIQQQEKQIQNIQKTINKIEQNQNKQQQLQKIKYTKTSNHIPNEHHIQQIQNMGTKQKQLQEQIKQKQTQTTEAQEHLNKIEITLNQIKQTIKTCPLCKQNLIHHDC